MVAGTASERVVVVGAGQAGGEVVAALRQGGFLGRITLVGDEPIYPYSRPPLSKAYLKGETTAEDLLLRHIDVYERNEIDVRVSTSVVGIDTANGCVALSDGEELSYDHLVLATGGRPRTLPALEFANNVHYMRTKADADHLHDRLQPGARAVVIGGGYIGLEFAAVARGKSVEITVLESAPRLLARVSSTVISEFYRVQHSGRGVDIVLGAAIADFRINDLGDVEAVKLTDGQIIEMDFVLVGIGLLPNTELAESAGLAVDDGIVVDAQLRASVANVYAIGDVSRHPVAGSRGFRRLESVPNASAQARVVANAILGDAREYDTLPWFWSDQYDLKLQVAGVPAPDDKVVVRGNPTTDHKFVVLHLRNGRVTCAEVINDPAGFAVAKRLITVGKPVDPAAVRDLERPLKDVVI
jgi:3-phenylpropionate/trans-cinnamate dioxygenase ferredoxin reductase subunit